MSKRIYSYKDNTGRLCVDCAECERGGNGSKECSPGWHINKPGLGGCFIGTLLPKVQKAMEKGEKYYDQDKG